MVKKINILLVLSLLFITIGAVSASDDVNDIVSSDETVSEAISEDVTGSATHIIDNSNYNAYFDNKGSLIPSKVNEGDTVEISDNFVNKDFSFQKSVNVVGKENTNLKDCTFTFGSGASGSSISNLNIQNSKTATYGIFLNGASNCIISNCFINNTGASSYTICVANNANYNNVTNNVLQTYGETYGHGTRSTSPLLISGAHYNYVANNHITCDDANAIYLSSYAGGPLNGGASTFNYIYNNTVKYNVLPTSWSYGIQVMGGNNKIHSNTIIGAYRGISTSGEGNQIVGNKIINLTGADFNNPLNAVGGEIAIVGSVNSIVIDNIIINANTQATGGGISVLDNSIVRNNTVQVVNRGSGIHPQGSNITVENNNISTESGAGVLYRVIGNTIKSQSGVGVLIQKISSKRMPANITIRDNYISTGNDYAIDARDADKNSNNDIFSDGNTIEGKSKVATPDGEFNPVKPSYIYRGVTYNVTPSNYDDYFESTGAFKSFIKDGDILSFEGEFSNKIIFVNAAVKITGNNPIFYNTTFRLTSNGVLIENIKIINKRASVLNAWGILIYKIEGARVSNCNIHVEDPNAAYAIYVVESSEIEIINNRLYSSGNYLTYTLLAHTVEDCIFENNTIFTNGTGEVYAFETEKCLDGDENCFDGDTLVIGGSNFNATCLDGNCLDGNHVVQEIYRTYGILMVYSSGNTVSGNNVTVTSKLDKKYNATNSTNSIVGIDLYYNSHNNVFSQNNVKVYGNDNYIYGMGVLGYYTGHDAPEGQGASNNQFINNNIDLEGSYCVEGLIIGDESENTTIVSNIVDVKSDAVAYGINLEMSQKSVINNNKVKINAPVIYGIEVYGSDDNIITGNEFSMNAKQVYGLLLINAKNNDINSNLILANGTGEEIGFINFDSVDCGNAGVYLKSNSSYNVIQDNNFTSNKGYAIIIDNEAVGNTISNNYLVSEGGIGDDAVNNVQNNNVEYNYRDLVTGELSDIQIKYFENGTFEFTTDDSNLNGAVIEFIDIDGVVINSTVISDGKASFVYDFKDYTPASYLFHARVHQKNYKETEFDCMVNIGEGSLVVSVENVTGAIARTAQFDAIVKNILGDGISGITVEFYISDDGFPAYIGKAVTDKNGLASLNGIIPQIYSDNPEIIVKIENPYYFESTTAKADLTAYRLTSTNIEINGNVYPDGAVAILKDQNGNVLANKAVSVQVNGVVYNKITNANGEIAMPILSKGGYSVFICR